MKYAIALIGLVFFSAFVFAQQKLDLKKMEYTESFSVSGVSKDILFNRVSMWIHESFDAAHLKITVQDKQNGIIFGDGALPFSEGIPVLCTVTFNIADESCLAIITGLRNDGGNLNAAKPSCCYSPKRWAAIKEAANTAAKRLLKDLGEHLKTKVASETFLTVPLLDTGRNIMLHERVGNAALSEPQKTRFYLRASGGMAPGIFSTQQSGFGGNRPGGASNNTSVDAFPFYGGTVGIFLPGKTDNNKGIGMEIGYLGFPLTTNQTKYTYTSGTGVAYSSSSVEQVDGIELFPNYTFFSPSAKKRSLYTRVGLDIFIPSPNNIATMFGLKAEEGIRIKKFYLSAFLDYTVNNIYNSGFRNSTIVKPLLLGINIGYYPHRNGSSGKKHH
jgi:Domain of unknown function (DUF4468) with TBP-like fold